MGDALGTDGQPVAGQDGLFASAAIVDGGRGAIVKLVNAGDAAMPVRLPVEPGTSSEPWRLLAGRPAARYTIARQT